MEDYIKSMKNRMEDLKKAISAAQKAAPRFPEGRMRVSQTGKQVRFYHVGKSDDSSGVYITKENRALVKALAQKDYNEKFLKKARAELSKLECSVRALSGASADIAYQTLDPRRSRLVTPYLITNDLYADRWKSQPYKTNPYMPESKLYDTNNGEKVRSKTEAIIADMLLELGIPYRYEQELKLGGDAVRYPDFTLLEIKTRKEIYLEHFGLLDDEDYRNKCLHKLDEYRNNGIYLGKNLLITYESADCPFDIKGTRKMIRDLLCGS